MIYANAGATRPADIWLDRLNDGGRLILLLTSDKGFGENPENIPIQPRGAPGHLFLKGIGRPEEQIAGKLQDLDLRAVLRQQCALLRRADERRRSLVEPELVANDADPADIYRENHAAGEDAKQQRFEKPALGRNQNDSQHDQPVAQQEAAPAVDNPINQHNNRLFGRLTAIP